MQGNENLAIIVAGGRGSRLAGNDTTKDADNNLPKQYKMLGSRCILQHTIDVFTGHRNINHVLVVIHEDDMQTYERLVTPHAKLLPPVTGGDTRDESVFNGLAAMAKNLAGARVLIHDGVRPFVSDKTIDDILESIALKTGALPATPVTDTLKKIDEAHRIRQTIPRRDLVAAQTPQGFILEDILQTHINCAKLDRTDFTDDASMFESQGNDVKIIASSPSNFKITTREDLERARMIVSAKENSTPLHADIRTGTAYDVHAFEPGESVILCGLKIPFEKSLKGHSDADVALHALTDALLGTIGEGDIGTFFPPSDDKWKDMPSDVFLAEAVARVTQRNGLLNNVDITIICEAPKIGPHRIKMQQNLAKLLGLDIARISVKATTNEKLGFLGRGEGIAAIASATISFGVRT